MFAVIRIPDFLLQAVLRSDPEQHLRPVVLIEATAVKPVVLQLTPAAAQVGVRVSMTPPQALARCPGLSIKTRSADQERAAAEALLECAFGFSPRIETTGEGICTLDLQGFRDLDYSCWAGAVLQRLEALHLKGRIGIAETPLLALHAARAAAPFRLVIDSKEFLGELPIESLEASDEVFGVLNKWGIATVGEFIALGREPLVERLGPEALELFERATAKAPRPLRLAEPPENYEETMHFEHEIASTQPLLFVLRRFLDQITLRLELMDRVAEELRLRLWLTNDSTYERSFRIPAPTRQVETLFRVLDTHLEGLRTDHSITGLSLSAAPCRPVSQQFGLFETVLRNPNQFYETLGRLAALVGADRVGSPVKEFSHRPDAFRMAPVDFAAEEGGMVDRASIPSEEAMSVDSIPNRRTGRRTKTGLFDLPPSASDASTGLSLRRFRPAQPAEVGLMQGRPALLQAGGKRHLLTRVIGPQLGSGDWWDHKNWEREEWDVQTQNGGLYRIFREGEQWFVDGMYD